MHMNKAEVYVEVQKRLNDRGINISRAAIGEVIDVALGVIRDTVRADGVVRLREFGTFKLTKRAPRVGRNMRTGEDVPVPASQRMTFKAQAIK